MGANARSVDIAPTIRGAFMRSLKLVEASKTKKKYAGKSLSEIFADMIMEGDVKTAMDCIKTFVPKEMLVDVQGKLSLDTTALTPEQLKEVFDVPAIEPGDGEGIEAVQGVRTLEAPTRTPA